MGKESRKGHPKDATEVEEEFYEGPRGTVLFAVSIQFEAQADTHAWQRLIREMHFPSEEAGAVTVAYFASLPKTVKAGLPYLVGELLLAPQRPDAAYWAFRWRRAPNDRPPRKLLERSNNLSAFPQFLSELGKLWPASSPVQMNISATYSFDLQEWDINLPGMEGRKLGAGKRSLRLVPTRWEFKPQSGMLREVVRDAASSEQVLLLRGQGVHKKVWTPQFLNEADAAIWRGLKVLLKRR